MAKNCNNCKFGIFQVCDTLENNKDYQEIVNENKMFNDKEYEFKENFVCEQFKSRYIEYPLTISKINNNNEVYQLNKSKIGKFVKIKPCGEEYKNKTYLGLFLGDLPIGITVNFDSSTEALNLGYRTNPAIFVFDLNKIVYGCESWWGVINDESELKDITDIDINNTWYVKALKTLNDDK
jgi:hypothetical protein